MTTATGQVIHNKIDLSGLLDYVLQQSGYHAKKHLFAQRNRMSSLKKGIGFAAFMHGAGFTGAGEKQLASVVGMEATEEGKVRILSASTEIGQGTNTIFSQMAADAGIS
jgi:CO/xanthine dehydrogenase Mo-binding subunit